MFGREAALTLQNTAKEQAPYWDQKPNDSRAAAELAPDHEDGHDKQVGRSAKLHKIAKRQTPGPSRQRPAESIQGRLEAPGYQRSEKLRQHRDDVVSVGGGEEDAPDAGISFEQHMVHGDGVDDGEDGADDPKDERLPQRSRFGAEMGSVQVPALEKAW